MTRSLNPADLLPYGGHVAACGVFGWSAMHLAAQLIG
jgi:hypothetical protein